MATLTASEYRRARKGRFGAKGPCVWITSNEFSLIKFLTSKEREGEKSKKTHLTEKISFSDGVAPWKGETVMGQVTNLIIKIVLSE